MLRVPLHSQAGTVSTRVCALQLWGILVAEGMEMWHQPSFSPWSGVMVVIDVEVGAICCPSVINPASWS